jgi:hypothetical protein
VNVVRVPADQRSITLCEHLETDDGRGSGVYSTQTFTFDQVYAPDATQRDVYESSARHAVASMLQGYNATVMAYGQTGTGKTYTMEGFTNDDNRGIVPRATEHVFSHIQQHQQMQQRGQAPHVTFQVRASYMQIYNEVLSDLLKPPTAGGRQQLIIRQSNKQVYVDGLSEWVVRSPTEIYGLIERGLQLRATGQTKLSELSSRSHAIFQIIVEMTEGSPEDPTGYRIGKLNIVDLAGSEKVRQTGVTGARLEETKKINWSLHELGNVISALTDTSRRDRHVPYRNSKLTHVLTDSLGGNCKTTLIACISPALDSYNESLSTLKFANRAKNIKNDASINDDAGAGADPRALVTKYERELKRLRMMLQERSGGVMPPGVLDGSSDDASSAALRSQHQAMRDRVQELETALVSNGIVLLPDGSTARGADGFGPAASALDVEETEENKAQVERYKQLLLKQRDVMLNLTTRLNERDEQILRLQEELDAYDAHVHALEEANTQLREGGAGGGVCLTAGEAESFLAQRRVSDGRYVSESALDSPDSARNAPLLSPDAKLVELLQCGIVTAVSTTSPRSLPSSPNDNKPDGSGGGELSQQQFQTLEGSVRARLEAAVRGIMRGRILSVQHDLDAAVAAQRAAEARVVQLERALGGGGATALITSGGLAAGSGTEQRLLEDLRRERAERSKLAQSVEAAAFEVQHLRTVVAPALGTAAFARVEDAMRRAWNAVAAAEAAVRDDPTAWTVAAPMPTSPTMAGVTANGSGAATTQEVAQLHAQLQQLRSRVSEADEAVADARRVADERGAHIRALESTLRSTTASQQTALLGAPPAGPSAPNAAAAPQNAAMAAEIQQLKRALATHQKDRRAIHTIMSARIKVKVDGIVAALAAGSAGSSGVTLVMSDAVALQNLVNASIDAMAAE